MKGYVLLPKAITSDEARLRQWVRALLRARGRDAGQGEEGQGVEVVSEE